MLRQKSNRRARLTTCYPIELVELSQCSIALRVFCDHSTALFCNLLSHGSMAMFCISFFGFFCVMTLQICQCILVSSNIARAHIIQSKREPHIHTSLYTLYMYVNIYVCVYIYIYVCIYIHICRDMCTHTHTHTHT